MISLFGSWWHDGDKAKANRLNGSRVNGANRSAVLTLGGGGARGLAHLGVMQAIDLSGLHVERIIGVSMGSLIGGLSAVYPDAREATAHALALLDSPEFSEQFQRLAHLAERISSPRVAPAVAANNSEPETSPYQWLGDWYGRMERMMRHGHQMKRLLSGPAILSSKILEGAIAALIPDIAIEDTAIPLNIVAVDLRSGHRVVLQTGSLRRAILASTAIPGFFAPIEWDGMLLCDLGILEAMPLEIATTFATDLTIGVDVGSTLGRTENFETAFDVIMRMEEIGERWFRRHAMEHADLMIQPDVGNRAWYDFSDARGLILAGRSAGTKTICGWLGGCQDIKSRENMTAAS